jgi:hypothetical protein
MGRAKALLSVDGVVLAERVGRALAAAGCEPIGRRTHQRAMSMPSANGSAGR